MKIAAGVEFADMDLLAICRKYGVRELAVFGFAARGKWDRKAVRIYLSSFGRRRVPGLLELSALGRELSVVLGRRVDVAVKAALKPLAREETLSEAHVIFAEG